MKNTMQVTIDGKEVTVQAQLVEKKLWFKFGESVHSIDIVDLSDSGFKKSKAAVKSPDRITAPMPGKVTKIFVSEGQAVNRGDALLVMEAMKMEYTLKSDINSTVEKLPIKLNDQVTLGQLLVQLKETK
jgi:acetyl/propionyl-CoA carboxylase alpha subunit